MVQHIGQNKRAYTYSKRWRVKFNTGRFTTAKMYRRKYDPAHADGINYTLRGFFWTNRNNYRYDEYWNFGNNMTSVAAGYYLYNTIPLQAEYAANGQRFPFREIPAEIVTHDIGNGESDFQLDKIILDAQYDTFSYGYNRESPLGSGTYVQESYSYDPVNNPDPKLIVELRNTSYANELPTQTIDVVAANWAAVPGVNPWVSRNNTPGTTTTAENARINRESLALVVPFSKYRRCRAYISTLHKMTTVRSLQLFNTEFARRTYG
jgi:hypothetical protein